MQETNEQEIKIEVSEQIEDGVYSNLAIVMHSQSEFVLDFVHLLPNNPKAKVKSRVLLSPDNVKRLMRVLKSNIHSFEAEFGTIELPEDNQRDFVEMPNSPFPQGEA